MDSPVGALTLTASDEYLLSVEFGKTAEKSSPNRVTRQAKDELLEYFSGKRKSFSVKYKLSGTDFQIKVWQALLTIPYGKTASYKDIASLIGCPKAARAVGAANNKNKLPVIVPCHRVIGADSSLTGYAGGIEIKQKLLLLEKTQL